jgi:hypothetical protein
VRILNDLNSRISSLESDDEGGNYEWGERCRRDIEKLQEALGC